MNAYLPISALIERLRDIEGVYLFPILAGVALTVVLVILAIGRGRRGDPGDDGDDAAPAPAPGPVEEEDKLSSDSHGSSSVVSYELMTLPVPHQMIDLPLPVRAKPLLTSSFAGMPGKAASFFFLSPPPSLCVHKVSFPRLGC